MKTLATLAEVDSLNINIRSACTKLDKLQAEQAEDTRNTSKQSKTVERYWAKKQLLLQRRDECNTHIRNLGVLPQEAYEKYIGQRTDKVHIHHMT